MIRPLAIAVVVALAVLPASSRAEGSGPVIEHEPITSARTGAPLRIRARIRTQAGRTAFEPTAFVQVAGIVGYTRVAMKEVPGAEGQFEAEVPAALITGDFDYYLESFDSEGDGPGRVGLPEAPLRVLIAAAAPVPVPADKPVAPRLDPRPPPAEPLIVSQPPRPAFRSRSQLPTLALFAAAGLSFGLASAATVGHQALKREFEDSIESNDDGNMRGNLYQTGNTLGTVSVGGFIAAAVLLTSGIVYRAWPDSEIEPEPEPAAKPEVEPLARPAPEPEPAAKPKVEPQPKPEPRPAPKPAPRPAPEADEWKD